MGPRVLIHPGSPQVPGNVLEPLQSSRVNSYPRNWAYQEWIWIKHWGRSSRSIWPLWQISVAPTFGELAWQWVWWQLLQLLCKKASLVNELTVGKNRSSATVSQCQASMNLFWYFQVVLQPGTWIQASIPG